MGLRLKTASTISAIFLAVIGATYLLFSMSLLSEFRTLEQARTLKNLERVSQAIDAVKADLGNRALDWGHWDESLSFVQGSNPQYVESNLNYEALVPFELKHVIFLNRAGSIVYGAPVSAGGDVTQLHPSILAALLGNEKISAFLAQPSEAALTGLLVLDGQPTFVAVSSITDSKMQRAPEGFVIFTRELSEQLQKRIASQTLLPLSFRARHAEDPFPYGDASAGSQAVSEQPDTITGLGAIRDLAGNHIVTAQFSQPRDILAQGVATRNSLVAVMALFLVLANVVVLLFVDRTVLKPLARFARRLSTISKTNDLTLKLPVDRSDEIGKLSSAFNGLIDSLRHSYRRIHEARVAAQEANEAKSKFIATVSHELRTPIHSITGMLRMLRQRESDGSKRGYIDMANDAALGLLSTINEILDFSKAESGNLRLESKEFSVREVAERAARSVTPRREGGIAAVDLIVDIHRDVPETAIGDAYRLGQILTNLLGNACKFTHDGQVVLSIEAERPDAEGRRTLVLYVEDTGIGIPKDQAENIFKAFNQGAASTPRLYQGSGLGLSIVKQLVEAMGGSIALQSAEHRGATFIVRIPFLTSSEPRSASRRDSIALIAPRGSATERLVLGLLRHASEVDVFSPSRPDEMASLAASAPSFSKTVLWSTGQPLAAPVREAIEAALLTQRPVCAVLASDDLALRQELSILGVHEFYTKACHLARIVSGEAPSQDEQLNAGPLVAANSPSHASRPLRVLIADDTPTNCIILQSMLEDAGHSVEVVTNGLDLLNRLRPLAVGDDSASQVDLVLTDIQMPLMDGNTAIRKLRLLEQGSGRKRHLPVVAVTAHALPEEQLAMRQSGMDEIVTKPVSPSDLQLALSRLSGGGDELTAPKPSTSSLERALKRIERDASGGPGRDVIVDISGVFERSGQSLRRTRMILKAFLSAYGAPRDALAAASDSGDLHALSRAAHTLKGLLLDVGAAAPASLACQLEQQSKSADSTRSFEHESSQLISACGQVAAVLERIINMMPHVQ